MPSSLQSLLLTTPIPTYMSLRKKRLINGAVFHSLVTHSDQKSITKTISESSISIRQIQQHLIMFSFDDHKSKFSYLYYPSVSSPNMLSKQVTAAAMATLFLASNVHGHGHLVSPRSRNYVAHQDGKWWPADDTTPAPEDCPHCK